MTRALQVVLAVEVLLGLLWTVVAAMAHGPGGLAAFGVFLIVYAVFAAMVLFAAWVCFRHPGERRLAAWIILLPVAFLFAPWLLRSAAVDYLSGRQLVSLLAAAAAVLVVACWIVPRRMSRFVPRAMLRSRALNWLVLVGLIGGWLLLLGVVALVANDPRAMTAGGEAGAMSLLLAALYLFWLGVGSLLAATWAWLCLRGAETGSRQKLNIAQLLVAVPGVVAAVLVLAVSLNR